MSTSLERGELDEISKKPEERVDWTPRAVIFGVVIGLFGVWSAGVQGEAYGQITLYQNIMFTSEEPVNLAFIAALGSMFFMCILIPKLFPKLNIGFSRAELAVSFAAGLGVHGIGFGMYNVVNKIAGFGHYASTSGPAMQAWEATNPLVMPKDMNVSMDLLLGWADVPWNVWVVPILFWSIVLFFFSFIPMCMGVVMRKRWAEHEQLTYPLARAVVHLLDVEDDGTGRVRGFWKNKLLWIGASITFTLVFYEWVQLEIFPGLPRINRYFPADIIRQIRDTSPALNWAMLGPDGDRMGFRSWGVMGVLYLAPSHDFLFTWVVLTPVSWFVNFILYHAVGGATTSGARWLGKSATYFALPAFAILMGWRARAEIASSIRTAFSKKIPNKDLEDEGLTIREAVFGLILGTIIIFVTLFVILQIRLLWVLGLLVFFYTFAFSVARFRAEVAFPSAGFMDVKFYRETGQTFSAQLRAYPQLQPSVQDISGMGFINNQLRKFGPTLSMIHILEGCKIADETNLKRRAFFKSYVIGFALAAIPAAVMFLRAYYDVGTGLADSHVLGDFARLGRHLARDGSPVGYSPEPMRVPYGLISAGVVLLFAYLRAKYIWWPFHPIGWVMAGSCNIPAHITGPALVVLIIKGAILRYGGGSLYIKLTPLFIGLVFGELLAFIARWIGMAILIGLN